MSSLGYVMLPKNPDGAVEAVRYDIFVAGLFKNQSMPLMKMHAALGVCGEAGELADAIKKEVIYEEGMYVENIREELGDLAFYMQAVMNLYGIHEQEILQANADKLAKRYVGLIYSIDFETCGLRNDAAIERADKKPDWSAS
jgi:phosphoribosyl-ATP pyrophosphohydrolase